MVRGEDVIPVRQMRVRVFEALERRARQFRSRRELWPLRVPAEPVRLEDVIEEALPDSYRTFDVRTLRSRLLLTLYWDDGSRWDAWVMTLPSGLKLFCDYDGHENRILASARRDAEGGAVDEFFLELLSESAGEDFGIETSAIAPSRVRTSLTDRRFLVDIFVSLFEVAGTQESVRAGLAARGSRAQDSPDGHDFRQDVERWLNTVLE